MRRFRPFVALTRVRRKRCSIFHFAALSYRTLLNVVFFREGQKMSDAGKRPAFPIPSGTIEKGVSVRDWLAVMALQGVVSKGLEVMGDRVLTEEDRNKLMARRAYGLADAMIEISAEETVAAK